MTRDYQICGLGWMETKQCFGIFKTVSVQGIVAEGSRDKLMESCETVEREKLFERISKTGKAVVMPWRRWGYRSMNEAFSAILAMFDREIIEDDK